MSMPPRAVLMIQGGADEGSTIPLPDGMMMIGRSSLNDMVVDEPGVSRQHAGIRGGSDGYWISDLGSRNGTFVNGDQVGQEPRRLRNFDRIELDSVTIHWVFMESEDTVSIPRQPAG